MDWLLLLAGVACAGLGGEAFLRGAVGLAHWARVPPGIVGATVAAFATSSPELSVAVGSALDGAPEVSLGNVAGGNVVNIGAVLAAAILVAPVVAPRASVRRDHPVALLVPVLTVLLGLDGVVSRIDGALLLVLFGGWLSFTLVEARRARDATDAVLSVRPFASILYGLVGLAVLGVAGRLIVSGAVGIASRAGLNAFVIGATVVSIGTTVPEMATAVMARVRGHQEIAIGTVLGSNIFNGLFIVGVAATICPIRVAVADLSAALVFGAILVGLVYPPPSGILQRSRGLLLLAGYVAYLVVILQRGR